MLTFDHINFFFGTPDAGWEEWATLLSALITLAGAGLAVYGAHLLLLQRNRVEIARLVRAEKCTLLRHSALNLVKLKSIIDRKTFGTAIDYKKMYFYRRGFVPVANKGVYDLPSTLAQDITRMDLFASNNDLEIEEAIDVIFRRKKSSDAAKWKAVNRLTERTERTCFYLRKILAQLEEFERSPRKYNLPAIDWPETEFQVSVPKVSQPPIPTPH